MVGSGNRPLADGVSWHLCARRFVALRQRVVPHPGARKVRQRPSPLCYFYYAANPIFPIRLNGRHALGGNYLPHSPSPSAYSLWSDFVFAVVIRSLFGGGEVVS